MLIVDLILLVFAGVLIIVVLSSEVETTPVMTTDNSPIETSLPNVVLLLGSNNVPEFKKRKEGTEVSNSDFELIALDSLQISEIPEGVDSTSGLMDGSEDFVSMPAEVMDKLNPLIPVSPEDVEFCILSTDSPAKDVAVTMSTTDEMVTGSVVLTELKSLLNTGV